MKGLFIPDITVEMFRNASVESLVELMAEGKVYDIDYQLLREIKMGRWVIVDDEYGDNSICECSECKDRVWMYKSADQKWNYCPNCGLRMESEVQNDRTN
jgi:hypothetical protein